jgi:hypothetical protein
MAHKKLICRFFAAALLLAGNLASPQSLNVDINVPAPPEGGGGTPSSQFGAAAGQVGYWNLFSYSMSPKFMNDLFGFPTNVLLTGPVGGSGFGFNLPGLTGDFRLLMADAREVNSAVTYSLSGLQNGKYRSFVYAVKVNGGFWPTPVVVSNAYTPNPQLVTGPMPMNTFTEGITHSVHVAEVRSGALSISIDMGQSFSYLNGFQIVQLSTYAFPTNYNVTHGLNFGGSLASVLNSDDDRASILNDEYDTNGEFEFTSTLPAGSVSQLKFKFEGRASRSDLSQFLKMRNHSTGIYTNVNVQTATLVDSIAEGSITSGANNYFSASREVKARATWIPQLDVDAMDGWVESCDQAMWEMVF